MLDDIKITTINQEYQKITVKTFSDNSASIATEAAWIGLDNKTNCRKAARALSPVYVVKSDRGYDILGDFWLEFEWQPSQKQALRFTSKKKAKALAASFVAEINPRVVRLK